jgi:hypothetical protein
LDRFDSGKQRTDRCRPDKSSSPVAILDPAAQSILRFWQIQDAFQVADAMAQGLCFQPFLD